jgi:hypothetical protein
VNEAVEIVANALLRADSAAASYHDLARVAIGALREPTAAMVAAGAEEACGYDGHSRQGTSVAVSAWESMIDAALA